MPAVYDAFHPGQDLLDLWTITGDKSLVRFYFIPVKYACNADCVFCITEIEKLKPGFQAVRGTMKIDDVLRGNLQLAADLGMDEVEITGGGEPFLHPRLQELVLEIRDFLPAARIKIYTNGFRLREIRGIDELNLSRAHDDSGINQAIFRSKEQNELQDALGFFRPFFKTIRLQVPLMQGALDTPEKLIAFAERQKNADLIVARPLFDGVHLGKERYVRFEVQHPKIKLDRTGDYCGMRPVIAADGNFYRDWNFDRLLLPAGWTKDEFTQLKAELLDFQPHQKWAETNLPPSPQPAV